MESRYGNNATMHHTTFYAGDDPLAFASGWLEEGSRLYFAAGSVFSILRYVRSIIPIEFIYGFNGCWRFYQATTGYIKLLERAHHVKDLKRRKRENAAWIGIDFLSSSQLNVLEILTLLAKYGAIKGVTAAAFAPMGSFAFAAALWVEAARAGLQLVRTTKKLNPYHLLEDRIIQYQNVLRKIAKLEAERLIQIEQEEQKKLTAQIIRWERTKKRLYNQALAIIHVNYKKHKFKQSIHQSDAIMAFINVHDKDASQIELDKKPTRAEQVIMRELSLNQREKTIREMINVIAWTSAAAGMTLMAVSPFAGPGAGCIFIAGCILMAASSVIKFSELMGARVINGIAKRQLSNTVKTELHQVYVEKYGKDARIVMAYELSRNALAKVDKNSFATYKQSLLNKVTPQEREKFLNAALEHRVEQEILRKALGIPEVELKAVIQGLSLRNRQQIIARYCRNQFQVKRLKHTLGSFFIGKSAIVNRESALRVQIAVN